MTAAHELFEEGRRLLDLRGNSGVLRGCPHVDINRNRPHLYRAYFLGVNGQGQHQFSCRKFYHTSVSHLPSQFQETTAATRFPIAAIKADWLRTGRVSSTQLCDKGQRRVLGGRIQKVLAKAFAAGIL